jgi:hypothetical protein
LLISSLACGTLLNVVAIQAKDVRKEVHYQVGITPMRTERAREHCEGIKKLAETDKPITECPPGIATCRRVLSAHPPSLAQIWTTSCASSGAWASSLPRPSSRS